MQSRLWLSLLILGFLGLCDAAHVADVATDAFDQSTSPQAAVASALITSKTSFAKHVEGKTGFLPGLLEESESLLMESELEMDTKEDSEIISTPSEAVSDNGFCSLLLVLRSILLALLLHLAVVYKRKIQIEATRATRASARPSCASKTPNACDTSDTSNPETEPKTTSLVSDSISDTHSQFELSELHPQTPQTSQTPQTVNSQRGTAAVTAVTNGKVGKVSCAGEFGELELHVAAAEANLEDMAELLKKGVDVNAVDAWDETALHMAVRSRRSFRSFAACELLLRNKADVNARNADDRTPLACVTDAADTADDPVSLCHLLLQHGAVLGLSEDALQRCCTTALVESLLRGEGEAKADAQRAVKH